MSKKLFVGGLSWGTTEATLNEAFAAFGEVSEAKVVTDRESGKSRGFGFVTFANDDDATKAMEELNGKPLDGRTITVNEAREKSSRDRAPRARY